MNGPIAETGPSEFQGFGTLGNDALLPVEAIQARPLPGLQFKELHGPHVFTRRSHAAKISLGSDQHDPCRADIEKIYASSSKKGQKFDRIEIIEQAVC
jgi:hypothetical protein